MSISWTNKDSLIVPVLKALYVVFCPYLQCSHVLFESIRSLAPFLLDWRDLKGSDGQQPGRVCVEILHTALNRYCLLFCAGSQRKALRRFAGWHVVRSCRHYSMVEEEFFFPFNIYKKLNWHLSVEQLCCYSGFKRKSVWCTCGFSLPPS